ncbi:hypothetical protein DACRYDRAFT_111215 [Dacryopinax primogenitus]|uniref:Uncharacterized protein n=1 Tax=Dacryopinax primogenitus (strain DJM 731) TaxID=1858805 RepID=M5FSP6_DACPD|nr:uncharacterized protein DACRYDRAFT_111215 [Dacryopinax primogenitus]EJT98244.1 hypothetical protein DACRYDRAFT_111215 [Dacryopinax primogenitus]
MDDDSAQMNDPLQPTIPEQLPEPSADDYVIIDNIDPDILLAPQEPSVPDAAVTKAVKTLRAELGQVTKLASEVRLPPPGLSAPLIVGTALE